MAGDPIAPAPVQTGMQRSSALALFFSRLKPDALGVEVVQYGPHTKGVTAFCTDAAPTFGQSSYATAFISDSRALPLFDESIDYLSLVYALEHMPDPIAALYEWYRVLRPGGLLLLILRNKEHSFDRTRATTSTAHMLEDHLKRGGTSGDVRAHIDGFVNATDWTLMEPQCTMHHSWHRQRMLERLIADADAGKSLQIHFHNFTPASLHELLLTSRFIGDSSRKFTCLTHADRISLMEESFAVVLEKRYRSRKMRRINTFELNAPFPNILPLPLVCPVTLTPLRLAHEGCKRLVSSKKNLSYEFSGDCPILIPPHGMRPRRVWDWRLRRTWTYLLARIAMIGIMLRRLAQLYRLLDTH